MDSLFLFAAQNTVVAVILATIVLGLTRVWRNPPAAHLLWLLILLKLIAPPIMRIDWPPLRSLGTGRANILAIADHPRMEQRNVEDNRLLADPSSAISVVQERQSPTAAPEQDIGPSLEQLWSRTRPVLLSLWLAGAGLCCFVAAIRIVRFERLLRGALPASERVQQRSREISAKLGIRRPPDVRYLQGIAVPFAWCVGVRQTIVLPAGPVYPADDQGAALILAHELAHLKRGDHWVRGVELLVSIVCWWNPLAWMIKRQIHHAEELCCDAWVRWLFPDGTRRYAEILLEMAEVPNSPWTASKLSLASPFLRSFSLKSRIQMVLENRFTPSVSRRSMFAIGFVAVLVLPVALQSAKTAAGQAAHDDTSAPANQKAEAATSAFPYEVQFEQGATRFKEGDKIAIVEIRGTAETFAPGNIYWIKGTYSLASHERATMAAYTTAKDAAHGRSTPLKVQQTVVKQGDGTFTLFLPMVCEGWPHISFYPAEGGSDFGGNYFGTGKSVLKKWWGTK